MKIKLNSDDKILKSYTMLKAQHDSLEAQLKHNSIMRASLAKAEAQKKALEYGLHICDFVKAKSGIEYYIEDFHATIVPVSENPDCYEIDYFVICVPVYYVDGRYEKAEGMANSSYALFMDEFVEL